MDKEPLRPLRPVDWVAGFALLVLCQLAGETLVQMVRLIVPSFAFPGPVVGMVLLVVLLSVMGARARSVIATGDGLLGILSLLFVPSAVGIIQHAGLIQAWGAMLLLAVLASTVLTLLVTVGVFILTEKLMAR